MAQALQNLPVMQETRVQSLVEEDSLERETATNSSILLCDISRTEEPGSAVILEPPPPFFNHLLSRNHETFLCLSFMIHNINACFTGLV